MCYKRNLFARNGPHDTDSQRMIRRLCSWRDKWNQRPSLPIGISPTVPWPLPRCLMHRSPRGSALGGASLSHWSARPIGCAGSTGRGRSMPGISAPRRKWRRSASSPGASGNRSASESASMDNSWTPARSLICKRSPCPSRSPRTPPTRTSRQRSGHPSGRSRPGQRSPPAVDRRGARDDRALRG